MNTVMHNISLGKELLKTLDGVKIFLNCGNVESTILCQDDQLFLSDEKTGDIWEITQEKSIKVNFNKYTFKSLIEDYCPKIIKVIQGDHLKQRLIEVLYVEMNCSDDVTAIWHRGDYLFKTPSLGWHYTNDIHRGKVVTSLSSIFSSDWIIDLPTPEELIIFEEAKKNKG